MALAEAPVSIDVTDIQLKLHSKYQLFNSNASTPAHNGVNLLATASTFGLVIVGRPSSTEIEVLLLRDVVERKELHTIPYRSINLPGEPYSIALNCDHTMLSVCYTANGQTFMDIYAVQTFLSNNVRCLVSKLMVSNDPNVRVTEILWNPVIGNTMALCLGDGTLGAYIIKDNSFEYNSIDKSENARCACWSPKGKQIVVAFPNGKLAQYKPDLKLAKTIPCTVSLFPGPFSPIAVQWLSTYQFAVVFVEDKEDTAQSLFIVNAPKNVPPTYINYYDINYSQSGPRAPQVFLIHIMSWNLILMGSSNGTEIGALGTNGNGETPLWTQYTFMDEARAELPLTADKQDTFPVGLALETGSTHKLVIGENEIPVMPMLHILSTHGFLLSFDLLNFQPTRIDICSPPQNIADQSGLRKFQITAIDSKPSDVTSPPGNIGKPFSSNDLPTNLTFSVAGNAVTSTPAKPAAQGLLQPKPVTEKPTVANGQPQPMPSGLFGGLSSSFGSPSGGLTGLGLKETHKPTPIIQQTPAQPTIIPNAKPTIEAADINNKPFLTLKPDYKPSTQRAPNKAPSSSLINSTENEAILRKMIAEEIEAFEKEIRAALSRSKCVKVTVCSKEELSQLMKNIDELQEITSQATETTESLKSDVQSLKLTLYEMLAMSAEAKSKTDDFNRSTNSSDDGPASSQAHRRYLEKLQSLLIQTQRHFDTYNKQIDAHWSDHIQQQRENDRDRMRVPSLEAVYQTLAKQYQILMKEKEKINKIKSKVGIKDSTPAKIKYSYSKTDNLKVNSLIDSVVSLTIGDQIKNERKPLKSNKVDELRRATISSRNINLVKPSRPDRKGLNSEIIIEQKLAEVKAQKEKQKKLEAERTRKAAAQTVVSKPQTVPAQPGSAQPIPAQSVQAVKTPVQTVPVSKPAPTANPSHLGSLSKPSFGISTPASATPISFVQNATVEKPQSQQPSPLTKLLTPSGSRIAKEAEKPTSSFGTSTFANTSTSSGFSLGSKTEATTAPSNLPSFSNLSTNKQTSFGNITVTKLHSASEPSIETKPTGFAFGTTIAGSNEPKPVSTPAFGFATTKEGPVTTPASPFSFNLGSTSSTPVTAAKVTTAQSTGFKFDTSNTNNSFTATPISTSDLKPSTPNAATPVISSAPIKTATSSIGSFSFSLGGDSAASTVTETKSTVSVTTAPQVVTISNPSTVSTSIGTSPTPASSGFSFATTASTGTSIFGTALNTSTAETPKTTTVAASTTSSSIPSSNANDPSSIFQGFNTCQPNVSETANVGKNLFGGNAFGTGAATATSPTSSASIFGGSSASSVSATSPSISTSGASIFGNKVNTPYTAASVPTTNLFAAKAAEMSTSSASDNIFGGKTTDSTSSIPFGGFGLGSASTNSSTPKTGNIFGSPAPTSPNQNVFGNASTNVFGSPSSASSIFGGAANNTPSAPSGNIFNSPAASAAAASSTASIFGGPAINTGSSIFGGAANTASSPTSSGSIFGNAVNNGNAFGGGTQNSMSGGSIFGGSGGFGSPSSQQQPQDQQQSLMFGGGVFAQAANSQPTFGTSAFGLGARAAASNPSFGSGPTFGSPKGFGTFGSNVQAPAFASPTKSNNLFESLGASENTMTFGNLAQTQSTPPQQPKPFGGGSSFSSWR